jgi:Arc/MetJ-type ribon-helix-helix transcriptional regulator
MISFRLEGEDIDVLEGLVAAERLSQSDVIRRALRAYASEIGVLPKPQTKPKRK